jgi:hypothetical protein
MLVIIGFLAVAIVFAFIEVPSLVKRKLRKELWTFYILLTAGVLLNIAEGLHWKLPNPLSIIVAVYKPISNIIFRLLK